MAFSSACPPKSHWQVDILRSRIIDHLTWRGLKLCLPKGTALYMELLATIAIVQYGARAGADAKTT